jgi:hypothetical protein
VDAVHSRLRTSGAEVELTAPDAPTPEEARAAAGRGADYGDPLFPDCVVRGPARAPGDGLRMTARLGARPRIGTECRMLVWLPGRDGRMLTAARTAGGSG